MRNRYRIIGGVWRGRVVHFPPLPELRPTPDRVRVTLFDWLRPIIDGALCLDLFAGSGALGIEALSQGAGAVVFVDRDRRVATHLEQTLWGLGTTGGQLVTAEAEGYLRGPSRAFDVVFLDPPYAGGLLPGLCTLLEHRGWLAGQARIYLEQPAGRGPPRIPPAWSLMRSKRAGQVGYHLAARSGEQSAAITRERDES